MVRAEQSDFERNQKDFQNKNYQDTKIYKQFTKAYKELQKKYERFEEGDQNRIDEIHAMNDAEAKAMVEKIMRAD